VVLTPDTEVHLEADLRRWVESACHGRLLQARRMVGGQSREAWMLDVDTAQGVAGLFLRREVGYGPMHGSVYTITREAQVYRALADTPLPVARVVAVHPDEPVVLLERVDGESYFPSVKDTEQREALADQFASILAGLHRLDPARLDLPPMTRPRSAEEHASLELDIWEHLYRTRATADPLTAFGFRWLRANAPAAVPRTVLVQGDTGPGNFLFRDGRIVAVTDWELAHLGDPMEDLGWVATRSLLQPFVDLPGWFRTYEQRSGIEVRLDSVRYWTICGVLRCVVGEEAIASSGEHNPERASAIGMLTMHRSILVDLLAEAAGVPLTRPEVVTRAAPTNRSRLYGIVDETLSEVVLPALREPLVAHQTRAAVRVLRHLELADRIGADLEREDRHDLAVLLGGSVTSVSDGAAELAARVDDGRLSDPAALLGYFARDTSRQNALCRPMMGRLALVQAPRLSS
jgi:aminoglycoside phosphotransferase (APT) family kinase protein